MELLHDKNGVPIYPGDLLRTFHFKARKYGKYFYLYHTVVNENGRLYMVPTSWLEPTLNKPSDGGRCVVTEETIRNSEVIDGEGPEPYLDYTDRPKVKRACCTTPSS